MDDPAAEAWAHRFLAHDCVRVGDHHEATGHMRKALETTGIVRDAAAQAEVDRALDQARSALTEDQRALSYAEGALCLARSLRDPLGEADACAAAARRRLPPIGGSEA